MLYLRPRADVYLMSLSTTSPFPAENVNSILFWAETAVAANNAVRSNMMVILLVVFVVINIFN
jgi:hypothetical protein